MINSYETAQKSKITTYEEFLDYIKTKSISGLKILFHLFAYYNSDKKWQFDQSIPLDNFCFTFHPTFWKCYSDFRINNFAGIYPHLFGDKKVDYTYFCELKDIYSKSTNSSFSVTKEDFIKAYRLWTKVREINTHEILKSRDLDFIKEKTARLMQLTPQEKVDNKKHSSDIYFDLNYIPQAIRSTIRPDKDLEILYYEAKEFYSMLNKFEEFLFELSANDLFGFNSRARETNSSEFLRIEKFTERHSIYSYKEELVIGLKVKRSEFGTAPFGIARVEFDTKRIIDYFENKEKTSATKSGDKSGEPGNFKENDLKVWSHLFSEKNINFHEKEFPSKTLLIDQTMYYANIYRDYLASNNLIKTSKEKKAEEEKLKKSIHTYYRNEGYYFDMKKEGEEVKIPVNKIKNSFLTPIFGKKKKKSCN